MTRSATTSKVPRVAVFGASGTIGREVARLAVAYGCDVLGVCRSGQPPTTEPWTAGVVWKALDVTDEVRLHDTLEEWSADGCDAILVALPTAILSAFRKPGYTRVVEIGCARGPEPAERLPAHVIHLRTPPVDETFANSGVPPSKEGIAASGAAMAALRVALEPDHAGRVEAGRVAYLADAMFLQ